MKLIPTILILAVSMLGAADNSPTGPQGPAGPTAPKKPTAEQKLQVAQAQLMLSEIRAQVQREVAPLQAKITRAEAAYIFVSRQLLADLGLDPDKCIWDDQQQPVWKTSEATSCFEPEPKPPKTVAPPAKK